MNAPVTAADRIIRTIEQVLLALVVAWPLAVAALGQPATTIGWIVGGAAAAVVFITAVWNVIVPTIPGPHRRVVRTVVYVVLAVLGTAPAVADKIDVATSTAGWGATILGAAVVLFSAVQNGRDRAKAEG